MKNMFYFLFLICNIQSFPIYIMLNNNIEIKLSALIYVIHCDWIILL